MTPLRQRMIDDMRIRNFSIHTIGVYVRRVAQFARYCKRPPDQIGPEDVRAYQVHLANCKVNYPILSQTVGALRFFYKVTLGVSWDVEQIPYPKGERRLPVVISREEVLRFLGAIKKVKHRAIVTTLYAAGLRISEGCQLRIWNIDSHRKVIHVHCGKGPSFVRIAMARAS